ncbi:hypothetical protein F2P81_004574 [Scophthalmus maximus]|uniref:Uncharacterized protein n=1 Tax=Scophthalmus maximus TaxID=52904 RepID=A0A6A4T9Y6_SCOMX|nr:hypothetical protein F2P81_004574 [Scophthalmus maximus]
MADSGAVAARRCDSGSVSSVSMDTISALTELEDLERVYQQLCAEEVRINPTANDQPDRWRCKQTVASLSILRGNIADAAAGSKRS